MTTEIQYNKDYRERIPELQQTFTNAGLNETVVGAMFGVDPNTFMPHVKITTDKYTYHYNLELAQDAKFTGVSDLDLILKCREEKE